MKGIHHHRYAVVLAFFSIISLGLLSFAFCIIAELTKSKVKDLKMDGRLCYLPGSRAFRFGIVALSCLLIAQIVGNMIVCLNWCWKKKSQGIKNTFSKILMALSWLSFGVATIIISAATSMNREQDYGKGWLESECYIVKDGLFAGSAVLVLFTVGSTLGSAITTINGKQLDQVTKITRRDWHK